MFRKFLYSFLHIPLFKIHFKIHECVSQVLSSLQCSDLYFVILVEHKQPSAHTVRKHHERGDSVLPG